MADAMATQKFHLQKLDVNFPFSASPPEESAMESKEKLIVGVCVLEKKALSSPMTQILDRLRAFGEFDIVMFGDDMILNSPIEKWPICDWLIAFYSTGYPLDKAEAYVELRKPNLVNEITAQRILHDRRNVYQVLEEHEIPTPAFLVVNREDLDQDLPNFREEQDLVEYDGRVIHKPFVEKPVDGDDHNVRIYYPSSAGGGMKELFRKVGNRSSVFHPDIWQVRRSGCYLYEEFMPTGGTDVKVYTVGPDYAHAEARKSPVVDGVVNRSPDGKEVRYPVLLTPAEKAIARVICLAFRQSVCGFDLLRCNGKSYVCDVNGWSFVKNSHKYYDDAAMVLRSMFLGIITPDLLSSARHSLPWGLNRGDVSPGVGDLTIGRGSDFGLQKELRSVIAIIRHGDRTPKQKVKLKVTQERLLHLMMKYNGGKPKSEAKLKSAVQLEELLDICKKLVPLQRPGKDSDSECEDNEHLEKLRHVRAVLEEGGHFSGIYRKVQLKPQAWTTDIREEGEGGDDERPTEALMVLKYGGVLTHAGRKQAEELGRTFRNHMYPGTGRGDGTGLLRLHSTYRHDLKIYSSDEGRVQMSAAAFAKGLLDLEGQLTPILVSLVSKDSPMLDTLSENANSEMESAKASLYNIIMSTKGRNEEGEPLSPKSRKSPWMMDGSGLPSDALAKMHQLVKLLKKITAQLKEKCKEEEQKIAAGGEVDAEMPPYHEARALGKTNIDVDRIAAGLPCGTEGFLLMFARWKKLERDVYNEKKNKFDISKIPDIYDSAKYDLLHNQHLQIQFLDELYGVAKELADGVIPNEYGINPLQKVRIGSGIARRLLGKILIDLGNTREEAMSAGTPLNRAIAAASLPPISSSADLSKRAEAWKPKKAGAESGKDMAAPREISSQSCRKVSSDDEDKEAQYRLDPKYANVRTPLRHVRTRLYFTSESHIHSVMNVLRYCHLDDNLAGCQPVVAEESLRMLFETKELDYLTHIVFQLYEHTNVPICDPNRFKIEILLSSGAAYSPLEVSPRDQDHTLPVRQPQPLLGDRDLTLQHLEDMLQPFAMPAEDFPPASTPQGFSGLFLKGGNVLERLANLWPFYRSSSHS